jgi:hypothetical protein
MKSHLARFLRSPLGLLTLIIDAVPAVVLFLTGLLSAPVAVLVFALVACVSVLTFMHTGLGAKAVVQEKAREVDERNARILGGVAAARKRLSLLRIGDPAVSAALERLVYAAGKYLEASIRGAERDPASEDAVLGAIEVVDDYLRMEDAATSGRRFHGNAERSEDEKVEGGGALSERTSRALTAAADEIERRLDLAAGGLVDGDASANKVSAADRAAARGELDREGL